MLPALPETSPASITIASAGIVVGSVVGLASVTAGVAVASVTAGVAVGAASVVFAVASVTAAVAVAVGAGVASSEATLIVRGL